MDIKISVILTSYNTSQYLSECMDSILSQSLEEFELLCIDDASKDISPEILAAYQKKDKRVQVFIMPQQRGVSDCRNYGLALAKGKYVIFLDSDDKFKHTMFEELYANAEKNNSDVVVCNSEKYDDLLDELLFMKESLRTDYLPQKAVFCYKDMPKYIFNFCKGWAWDKLYLREFLIESELQFPKLRHTEDAVFVYPSLILARRISIQDSVLVVHRIRRKDSVSSSHDANVHDFETAIVMLRDFLKQQNLAQELAESFENMVIHLGIWYLHTLKETENRKTVYQMLHQTLFREMDEHGRIKQKNAFYQVCDYYPYRQIVQHPYSEKQLKKIKRYYYVTRGFQSLSENGLRYWIKRGFHRL